MTKLLPDDFDWKNIDSGVHTGFLSIVCMKIVSFTSPDISATILEH